MLTHLGCIGLLIWQQYRQQQAAVGMVRRIERAVMGFNRASRYQRQSLAMAARVAGMVKGFENLVEHRLRDPGAVVNECAPVLAWQGIQTDDHRAAQRRMLQRITQQVVKGAMQQFTSA